EAVGEGGARESGQTDRLTAADHVDTFSGACVQAASSIAPDHRGSETAGEYFDRHPGSGPDHEGAGEEAVCTDRYQQHGFDVGPDHGPATGECVSGGSGRG